MNFDGLWRKPGNIPLDDFLAPGRIDGRKYRFRSVEAWSAVIPRLGIPLVDVIRRADPSPSSRFVEMTTPYDPARLSGQRR